jgi:hypothetical protein
LSVLLSLIVIAILTAFSARRMTEIVPLVDYIVRKRLASPLGFAAGGNIYNAVSQGGVGNAADTLEAMLFGVEVPPEAFEQVTIFAFGSIASISLTTGAPVLGAPTMGAAKNARLYWGATLLADFQATATQSGVWAVTATVNKTGSHAQVALLATNSMGTDIRDIAICAPAESDAAAVVIKVTGQSSAAMANLVTCNQLCVNGYGTI